MNKQYDAIVIGAGQAGPSLAVRLANAGKKVALIERELFGGTCVNTGCIPTKTLLASATVAEVVRKSADFGIHVDSFSVDMKAVKKRKDEIVNKYSSGVEKWLMQTKNCTVIKGQAVFENSHTIRVDEELLEAEKIFINVGARARIPNLPGIDNVDYYTNSTILSLEKIPQHLIIIGGSYSGLEFAQIYRRLGAKVTVIEKSSRLISKEDEDISEAVKNILEKDGVDIRLNAECIALDKDDQKIIVNLDCHEKEKQIIGTHLLLVMGRQPNTDDLGLDKAGVEIDEHGIIKVNDQLQTSVPHIWALGECNGKGAFTHTSYNDYEIVAGNLLDNLSKKVSDRILTYALFIDPPLGRAGMTETDARKLGKKILIAKKPMEQIKRAVIKGDTQGFIKIVVDADNQQILGAAILGVEGDEVIHSLLDIMYAKAPYTVVKNAVHIHPTVSELIPTILGELKNNV